MSIYKRLDAIEALHAPKKELPTAWVATIAVDGKVTLAHAKHDTIHLNSRDDLHQFIVKNDLQDMDILIVDIVNAKGEPPEELELDYLNT